MNVQKLVEDVRKSIDFKLVADERKLTELTSSPRIQHFLFAIMVS